MLEGGVDRGQVGERAHGDAVGPQGEHGGGARAVQGRGHGEALRVAAQQVDHAQRSHARAAVGLHEQRHLVPRADLPQQLVHRHHVVVADGAAGGGPVGEECPPHLLLHAAQHVLGALVEQGRGLDADAASGGHDAGLYIRRACTAAGGAGARHEGSSQGGPIDRRAHRERLHGRGREGAEERPEHARGRARVEPARIVGGGQDHRHAVVDGLDHRVRLRGEHGERPRLARRPGLPQTGETEEGAALQAKVEGLPVLRALRSLPFVEAVGGDEAAPGREGLAERPAGGRGLGARVDERLVVGHGAASPSAARHRPGRGRSPAPPLDARPGRVARERCCTALRARGLRRGRRPRRPPRPTS